MNEPQRSISELLRMSYQEEKEKLLDELSEKGNFLYKGLMVYNKIPEYIFRDYFLPFFLNERQSENWVMEWISIAGSPSAPVTVMNDTMTEELFTVPPIFNTQILTQNTRGRKLYDIIIQYKEESRNIESVAKNKFIYNLHDYANNVSANSEINIYDVWLYIVSRYRDLGSSNKSASSKHQDDNLNDFIDE